jgi:hypothetical protein
LDPSRESLSFQNRFPHILLQLLQLNPPWIETFTTAGIHLSLNKLAVNRFAASKTF